ncbi:MAG: hypothetical protein WC238_02665 [Parcubacteria group bacterium]
MIKIEKSLGIPRSTLSGWFKDITLSKKQESILLKNKFDALREARKKAVLWHNAQKNRRIKEAEEATKETLKTIDVHNIAFLELALAFLYLGEGAKKHCQTALGSSDPMILQFFLAALKNVYNVDLNTIKCELGLRADQNPEKMKLYWSKTLGLPLNNFKQVNIDKRTLGKATYPHYKGVCHLRCGHVAIQRKLMLLADAFCKKIISKK